VAKIKVKEIREAKGITQEAIAKELGITQASYSYKENGKRGFKPKELLLLEKILNVSIREMFGE
jgi:transcriptional regulator with XRE-family HTH domain